MRVKWLIQTRDKSQEVGLFERSLLICKAARVGVARNSRESHAMSRDKNKEVATAAPQPPDV
jgi:hypothetical protein